MTDHTTPLRGEAARTASSPPAEAPRFVAAVPHWLRVSIGLPEENARFIEALRQALA